jgi:hypothetical protein
VIFASSQAGASPQFRFPAQAAKGSAEHLTLKVMEVKAKQPVGVNFCLQNLFVKNMPVVGSGQIGRRKLAMVKVQLRERDEPAAKQ